MGRPKKKKADMKEHIVTVRFSEKEYQKIKSDSLKVGLSISDYIRNQINKGKVIAKYEIVTNDETKTKLAEEYHKIGINLNQIAHHLNNGGIVNDGIISAIKKNVSELSKLRRELK